jgi:histidinol-phosphatase (PHP family)
MVWFSYHGGHSGEFCNHAKSSLEEIVETAVARGFTHYGLTEHCPRYREQDLLPGEEDIGVQGLIEAFERYVPRAFALRETYAGRVELLIGFETECVPPENWLEKMQALRQAHPFDYLVGSVHDINGCWVDYSPRATQDLADQIGGPEALQMAYFDAVIEMVEKLRPDMVAHLDLVRKFEAPDFAFSPQVFRKIEQTLEAIKAYGGVLDINCAAFRNGYGPVYPLPDILRRACEMGIAVTLGDDSHGVDTVGVGLTASKAAIDAAGYRTIAYLTRKHGWLQADIADVSP